MIFKYNWKYYKFTKDTSCPLCSRLFLHVKDGFKDRLLIKVRGGFDTQDPRSVVIYDEVDEYAKAIVAMLETRV